MVSYNQEPTTIIKGKNHDIPVFQTGNENIDSEVVKSFGAEWNRFHLFSDEMIQEWVKDYFDIVDDKMITKESKILDVGCGSGRWSRFLSPRVKFVESIDPSDSIFAADVLLKDIKNVRLSKASIENIPFPDESFDFVMSVGVLHHTPDTKRSLNDCVKKVKRGGYFYCYLYHNLETMNWRFKLLFNLSEILRKIVSSLPTQIKTFVCDVLAVIIYMPFVLLTRFLMLIGLKKLAERIPLSCYYNKSFVFIRNDSLDKFGTKLEQRFSKDEVIKFMTEAGLSDIIISDRIPLYHAVGKKK